MIKLTKQRRLVYDILKESEKPLNAERIFELLPNDVMNLSTVYRTIEYFERNDLLLKFYFNGKSFYFLNNDSHHHYFICTKCHSMFNIDCNLSHTIDTLKNERNFLITNHEMTVYGLCEHCQNAIEA